MFILKDKNCIFWDIKLQTFMITALTKWEILNFIDYEDGAKHKSSTVLIFFVSQTCKSSESNTEICIYNSFIFLYSVDLSFFKFMNWLTDTV